ncbi:MAG: biotin transporter BioY [Treponema sp.]|jgi:biotin transport system substrate-specific component|nr:biotin transporter BioY [Treponema sp.]
MPLTGKRYVFSALFAALTAVSGLLVMPLPGGVPIVLKNLFVVLAGTVLGSFYGGVSALIFLAAGVLGLPVFVIPGGPGVFLTSLGGYLAGYFVGSLAAGLIAGLPKQGAKQGLGVWLRISLASFSGFALINFSGALYMMALNKISLKAALLAGLLPFVPGDLIKCALSIPLAMKLRPIAARYLNPGFSEGAQDA